MQTVFDKIIEKLEEQKSGLTEWAEDEAFKLATDKAIEIVKQESEQYNNGFNDICEIGLPPVGKPLIVTVKDNLQGRPNELRYPVYYEKDSMKCGYHWSWRYGDFAYELVPDVSEVIAWQPLPQPFQKGE